MEFPKDILMIDFEGLSDPIQIGAVLLDKKTLQEKDSFESYIWRDLHGEVKAKSGITQEMLEGAPSQAEVGKAIFEKFGTDLFIGSWVAHGDSRSFDKIIKAAGLDSKLYDYHILDLWPAAYIYLLKRGYSGNFDSESMFREFGIKPRGLHDALEDSRIAAEILRKIALT